MLALVAAAALTVTSCSSDPAGGTSSMPSVTPVSSEDTAVEFTLEVVKLDGTQETQTIRTTEKTVGAALLEKGLVAGEDSQYGLYIKTVCGETHDYDKDGKYWAFYINGELAPTGVDSTEIVPGATYSLKAE